MKYRNILLLFCIGAIYSSDKVKKKDSPDEDEGIREAENDEVVADRCSLPAETGKCRGSFAKYYYDGASSTCKPFQYGGCDGNDNRFDTEDECIIACGQVEKKDSPNEDEGIREAEDDEVVAGAEEVNDDDDDEDQNEDEIYDAQVEGTKEDAKASRPVRRRGGWRWRNKG